MTEAFFMTWIFRIIFSVFILFLASGLVNYIEIVTKRLIDHYFLRRQEAIDKMLRDGLKETSKFYN